MKSKYRNTCIAGLTGFGCLLFGLLFSCRILAAQLDAAPQPAIEEGQSMENGIVETEEIPEDILSQSAVFYDTSHITVTIQNLSSIEKSSADLFDDASSGQNFFDKIILTESLSDYFIFNIEEIPDEWTLNEDSGRVSLDLNGYITDDNAVLTLPVELKEEYQNQAGTYPVFPEDGVIISCGEDLQSLSFNQLFLEHTAPVSKQQTKADLQGADDQETDFNADIVMGSSLDQAGDSYSGEDTEEAGEIQESQESREEVSENAENDSGEEAQKDSFEEYIQNEVIGNQSGELVTAAPTQSPELSPDPLPAFTVEKTADRLKASPGDTITYHICIQNTGNVTLHSVLSVERFQAEGITAYFIEKEGVTLLDEGKRARIEEILPGESASLEAIVTLPENFRGSDLINQVVVTTQETGETEVTASASTLYEEVQEQTTETPAGNEALSYDQPESNPKTGDSSPLWILLAIVITSFLLIVCAGNLLFLRKERRM